jgi:hypothetical protein
VNNYFAIERDGKCIEHLVIRRDDDTVAFEDVMQMSYEELKAYEYIDAFIAAIMDAANSYFNEGDAQTAITLVGEDGVFIWGLLIGPGDEEDEFKYCFIDWLKDGKKYRYEKN